MASQIILFSQPRSGSKYLQPPKEFLHRFSSPGLTDAFLGHLLERMLTKDQSDVQVLSHPFSASRGKQVPWLLRDDYAEGMQEDEGHEYEDQIQKEVRLWEKELDKAEVVSSSIVPSPRFSLLQSNIKTDDNNTL